MIAKRNETPIQYAYRALAADINLRVAFFSEDVEICGYCLDAPVQLVPTGCCVNDKGEPKQGLKFNA